jgi:hypothetical protein
MKKRLTIVAVALLGIWTCGQGTEEGAGEAETPTDTLTTQERDSIMAELPIPGIGGIGAARRASDAAAERAEAHDTIG